MALLIGGVSFDEQISKLDRGVDVLIATPGRLLDHFERGRILLTDIKILVIDEADRMMDMGFMPDVERIVAVLPKIRNTLFFSATMPPEIRRVADKFLINPKEITVSPEISTAETVKQSLVVVAAEPWLKRDVLRRLITTEPVENALVFCNRKRDVDLLNKSLLKHGFNSAALHGDMTQPARLETLQAFRDGKTQILVASDVAARGLDMPKVSHVFNFDVPNHAEDYVHRIGRTGRAGRAGRAHMIATPEDSVFLDAVIKFIGNEIEQIDVEGVESASMSDAPPRRGRGGSRRPGNGPAKGPAKGPRRRPARAKESSPAPESAPTAAQPIASAPVVPVASATPAPDKSSTAAPRKPAPRQKSPPRERKTEEPVLGMGPNAPAFILSVRPETL